MDDCRRTAERLTPYVDEALPPGERTEVERHLDHCPPCRRSAVEEQGGRQVLRAGAERLRSEPLPPGLRTRCEALAREHCGARARAPWLTRVLPVTLTLVITTIAAVALFSLATRRSGALLAAQLTADHVACFQLFEPDGEIDSRRVEQQLEARYGWRMHVPPSSAAAGVTLVAGRRCRYARGPIPHVMYRAAGTTPVSLYRLDGVTREEADVTTIGYRCRIWSRGGHTYALVSRASREDAQVAHYLRHEAR